MAFSTAFQPNAFQNNAFQVAGIIPPPPPPLGDMHDGIDKTDRFAEKTRQFRKDAEQFHAAFERAKERAENPQKFARQPVAVIEAAPLVPSPTLSSANVAALMTAYKLAQQQADDDCIVALLLAA